MGTEDSASEGKVNCHEMAKQRGSGDEMVTIGHQLHGSGYSRP